MTSVDNLTIMTALRGYHFYRNVWTNLTTSQKIELQKQPNNNYDKHAIGGYVRVLEEPHSLTLVGHLPRDLSKELTQI